MSNHNIYVTGHKHPDSDSICSAIAFANLLNKTGSTAIACRQGPLNEETKFIIPATIDEIIKRSDIISIHCPLDGNKNLFDATAFKCMKKTAYIINVSRGGIINEKIIICHRE